MNPFTYKRFAGILLSLCLSFACCGCVAVTTVLDVFIERDEEIFTRTVDEVFGALDSGDLDALKALLAPALAEQSETDAEIEALFDFYQGPVESIDGADVTHESATYGEYNLRHVDSDFTVHAGGEIYHVFMEMHTVNDADPSQIGIRMLDISTEEAYESEYFARYMSDWGDDLGIYVQVSSEKRADICKVDDHMLRYQVVPDADGAPRTLSESDVLAAIQQEPTVAGLEAALGEANARWENYGYYYYELKNGLWAVCGTEWWDADIDDGVDGNQIGYVYIADKNEMLEILWMRETVEYDDYDGFRKKQS